MNKASALTTFASAAFSKIMKAGGKITKALIGVGAAGGVGYGALEIDQSIRGQDSIKTALDTNQAAAEGAATSAGTWAGIKEAFANFLELIAVIFDNPDFAIGLRDRLTSDKERINGDVKSIIKETTEDVKNSVSNTLENIGTPLEAVVPDIIDQDSKLAAGVATTGGLLYGAKKLWNKAFGASTPNNMDKSLFDGSGKNKSPSLTTAKPGFFNKLSGFVLGKSKIGKFLRLGTAAVGTGLYSAKSEGSELNEDGSINFQKNADPTLTDTAVGIIPFADAVKQGIEDGEVNESVMKSATVDAGGLTGMFAGAAAGGSIGGTLGALTGPAAVVAVPVGTVIGGIAGAAFGEAAVSSATDWAWNKLSNLFNDESNPAETVPTQKMENNGWNFNF